jgi:hypothetical protein
MAKPPRAEQRKHILDQLADGKSLRSICREPAMPAISTVMEWCSQDKDWAEQYARARAAGDDAMAEDIQDIADREDLDPQDRKVRIDARKWLLAKRQPRKYGDKIDVTTDGESIRSIDEVGAITRLAALTADLEKRLGAADDAG